MHLADVKRWVESQSILRESMTVEEVDKLVCKFDQLDLSKWEDEPDDEKENIEGFREKGVFGKRIFFGREQEKEIINFDNSGIIVKNMLNDQINNTTTAKTDTITEPVAKFKKMPNCVKYWKWECPPANLEKRFQPQRFQHHVLEQEKLNKDYRYFVDYACPPSPTDSDMKGNALMLDLAIRLNAVKFKYRRTKENCEDVMCRLCPGQRWTPLCSFSDHLSFVHGIVPLKGHGLVALPPPVALYKQQLDHLKFYYAKCPGCLSWIRLGRMAGIQHVDSRLEAAEYAASLLPLRHIEGLFTNYFAHFMHCAVEGGKTVL